MGAALPHCFVIPTYFFVILTLSSPSEPVLSKRSASKEAGTSFKKTGLYDKKVPENRYFLII